MSIDKILNTVTNWDSNFERLARYFNNEDYGVIMDETNWYEEDYMECYQEAYNRGNWETCLSLLLEDWLKEQIYSHTRSGTENLFRLWFESV